MNRGPFEDPRAVLRRHDLHPKKSWGQNFLVNRDMVERIAEAVAEGDARQALEIGAGTGVLTVALARRFDRVIAVERDPELVALLGAELPRLGDNVELLDADAVGLDLESLVTAPTALAGNLPYQITGRLLRMIIDARGAVTQSVVMVQAEVAERLVASPGSKSYGILTVLCQAYLAPTRLFKVSPGSFHPRPKVASAVIRLRPLEEPRAAGVDEAALSRLVHAAFGARRKTLRNTLSAAYPKEAALAALEAEGIDPGLRAEVLTVEQLAALARRLS